MSYMVAFFVGPSGSEPSESIVISDKLRAAYALMDVTSGMESHPKVTRVTSEDVSPYRCNCTFYCEPTDVQVVKAELKRVFGQLPR